MSEEEIKETKKNIDFWERKVEKALEEDNIMKAIACRALANHLRKIIGEKEV